MPSQKNILAWGTICLLFFSILISFTGSFLFLFKITEELLKDYTSTSYSLLNYYIERRVELQSILKTLSIQASINMIRQISYNSLLIESNYISLNKNFKINLLSFPIASTYVNKTLPNQSIWYNSNPIYKTQVDLPPKASAQLDYLKNFESYFKIVCKTYPERIQGVYFGTEYSGLFYFYPPSQSLANSYIQIADRGPCSIKDSNYYSYDPRCRPWYIQTINDESSINNVIFISPYYSPTDNEPTLTFTSIIFTIYKKDIDYDYCAVLAIDVTFPLDYSDINNTFFQEYFLMRSGTIISNNLNNSNKYFDQNILDVIFPNGSIDEQKEFFQKNITPYINDPGQYGISFLYENGDDVHLISLKTINLFVSINSENISHIMTLAININTSLLTGPIIQVNASIRSLIFKQIIIYSIFLSIIFLLLFTIIKAAIEETINPFDELSKKVTLLKTGKKVSIILNEKYNNCSYQYKELYESFRKINILLTFSKNKIDLNKGNEALLDLAEAYQIFNELNNFDSSAICISAIGTIHLRAKRYREAAMSYLKAIDISSKNHQKNQKSAFRNYKAINAFRKMQFAICKYYINFNSNKEGWEEGIHYINKAINSLAELGNYPDLIVLLTIKLSELQLQSNMTLTASSTLKKAFDIVNDIDKKITKIEKNKREIDIIPSGILRQHLLTSLGLSQIKTNKFPEAVKSLSLSLKISQIIDQNCRKQALELLEFIFRTKSKLSQVPSNILKSLEMHSGNKHEYLIIFDFSIKMSPFLKRSLNLINAIFDTYIQLIDKVSIVLLDNEVKVLFSLVEKWKNTENLKNQILRLENKIPTSRSRRIYEALKIAISLLKSSSLRNPIHSQWIIIIASGMDNVKDISNKKNEILEALKNYNILSIVLNNSNDPQTINLFEKLVKISREGLLTINPSDTEINTLMRYTMNYEEKAPFVILEDN